ncbi:MAG TPA: hypothetical protein VGG59_05965, partial [Acidobacteriaceae bacterium]
MRQSKHRLAHYSPLTTNNVAAASGYVGRLLHRRVALSGHGRGRFAMFTATLKHLEAHYMGAAARTRMRFYGDEATYLLLRLEHGAAEWTEGSRTLPIQPGEGLLISPGDDSLVAWKGGIIAITILAPAVEEALIQLTGYLPVTPLVTLEPIDLRNSLLGEKFTYLADQLEMPDSGVFTHYPQEGRDMQLELIERMVRLLPHNHQHLIMAHHHGAARRHADDIEQFLARHGSDRVVTAATIAASIGVSARTLRDVCHRIYRQKPIEVLRGWRLDDTHRRLENP